MVIRNFDELLSKLKDKTAPMRIAVAAAEDEHTIEAIIKAKNDNIASPILIGNKGKIIRILEEFGESLPDTDIYDASVEESCDIGARMVAEGKAESLMKGLIDTALILKSVVKKENGLYSGGLMSVFSIFEVPSYHKLITAVDGGMIPYPTLDQKRQLISNTVDVLLRLGYDNPKVGVLACIEKVNPKMPETVEAAELAEMCRRGEIKNCVVDGPISYDCAISREICEIKGYNGPTGGDADVLIAPNIHAGNIIGKMLTTTAGGKMAAIVIGAKRPIIFTSRGSTVEEKYLSILLCSALS